MNLVPYPEEAVRRYRDAGLWGTTTIATEFHRIARAHPHRVAVFTTDGRITFAALGGVTDPADARALVERIQADTTPMPSPSTSSPAAPPACRR